MPHRVLAESQHGRVDPAISILHWPQVRICGRATRIPHRHRSLRRVSRGPPDHDRIAQALPDPHRDAGSSPRHIRAASLSAPIKITRSANHIAADAFVRPYVGRCDPALLTLAFTITSPPTLSS